MNHRSAQEWKDFFTKIYRDSLDKDLPPETAKKWDGLIKSQRRYNAYSKAVRVATVLAIVIVAMAVVGMVLQVTLG